MTNVNNNVTGSWGKDVGRNMHEYQPQCVKRVTVKICGWSCDWLLNGQTDITAKIML